MVKPKKQSICVKRRKKKGYFGKIDGASQPTTESIRDTIMFYSVVLKEKENCQHFIKWKYRARWIELARQ
jgi:hypothetical protein